MEEIAAEEEKTGGVLKVRTSPTREVKQPEEGSTIRLTRAVGEV